MGGSLVEQFVGRDDEVAALIDALERASEGAGQAVLVTGEAGIGKTRLCEELAALARARGAAVGWATCWESGGLPAFWPWTHVLEQIGAGQLPVAAADQAPDVARAELFAAAEDALRQASATQPCVIVIDDAQWADPGTVLLLTHVATAARNLPVLVLATRRDAAGDPLVEVARHARTVRLAGLDLAATTALATSITGTTSRMASAALHRATAGNPLFAGELTRLLHAEDRFTQLASATAVPVPKTIRAVLDRRLAGLSADCSDVLQVAAAIGHDAPIDLVVAVTGLPADDVVSRVEEARHANVVVDTGLARIAFAHPLIRSAIYDDIGGATRVRLHQRIADALEADTGRPTDLAALSYHYLAAAPAGSAAKAVSYAARAAEEAMLALGFEQAAELYNRALTAHELAPAAADRVALLLGAGHARTAAGELEGARALFHEAAALARAAGRPRDLAVAALGLGGTGFEIALRDEEQRSLLEEALDVLPEDDHALRSRCSARLSVVLSLAGEEARKILLADDAVRLAEHADDDLARAHALAARCDARAGPFDSELRMQDSDEIIAIGRRRHDRSTELLGRRLRVVALFEMGDFRAADREILAFEQTATRLRQPAFLWYVPLWRAARALMEGRDDEGARLHHEAERIGVEAASPNAEILAISQRWFIELLHSPFDGALHLVQTRFPRELLAEYGIQIAPVLMTYDCLRGRPDDARTMLDALAGDFRNADRDSEWAAMLQQLTDVCVLIGGHEITAELYDVLLPLADRWAVEGIAAYTHGPISRALGKLAAMLGRPDEANAHFDRSLAAATAAGASSVVSLIERDRETCQGGPIAYAARDRDVFRRDGDTWTLSHGGKTVTLRDSKGLRDIGRLLAQPRREVAALDLVADGTPTAQEAGIGDVIDAKARDAYKARLLDIEAELDDADALGDAGRSARLTEERDALVEQLSAAYALGGRARQAGGSAERARSTVTARIRDAIRRVTAVHADLGRHLERSVRTGVFCSYDPETELPWDLTM